MICELSDQFLEDIEKLKKENIKLPYKVWTFISDIEKNYKTPLIGIGNPEYLKNDLAGYMSRRIDKKHRLIYKQEKDILILVSCYGHYSDN